MGVGLAETDRSSIQRVLDGDIDAFRNIVAEYKGLVFHVVRSMLANEIEHEDAAQDIFIKVYENLPRFEFRCGLGTWISRIAYNTCLNHLRRRKSHPQDNLEYRTDSKEIEELARSPTGDCGPVAAKTPHAVMCQKEIETTVRESIGRLPPHYRVMVTLHYLDGFSISELSETLGMPSGTIKSHLFRARAILKRDLLSVMKVEDLLG